MAPCMVFSIIGLVGLTKNWSIDEAKTGLKDNYIRAMFMNIRIWPPIQFINFTVVPVHLRLTFHHLNPAPSLAIIMSCGDIITQTLIERRSEWDIGRTAKFGSIGLLLVVWRYTQGRLRPRQPPAPSLISGLLDSVLTLGSGGVEESVWKLQRKATLT
ncbi:unnamed protein product [Schistocephalus solidus]|uniref:Mitochondrial inner membrane protein Mpv17 n=1 Tax=Schistocephalus solidus TaxID=70667 RepID=A0A183TBE5_SCHSO|nr:unnamed protein product [Schistocephalus solidus]